MTQPTEYALRECIIELLKGYLTGVRAIPEGELDICFNTGSDLFNQAVSSLVRPVFDIRIEYSKSTDQVMQPSPFWIENVKVVIETAYLQKSPAVSHESYMKIKSDSADIGFEIRSLLGWPGKLTTNDAGDPTGIISGILQYEGTVITKDQVPLAGQGPGLYTCEHTFTGFVMRNPAIS